MRRFTFVLFEGGGNVPAQLSIARRLVGRGHDVHVLGDRAVEADARSASCTFSAFQTAPHHAFRDRDGDLVRDWGASNPLSQIGRIADQLMFGPAERYARDVLTEVERRRPDALAVDCLLFGAMLGAERSGLPTAQLHHMPYSFPLPGVPPFGLGLPPAVGPLGTARDAVLGRLIGLVFERMGRRHVNAARAALGLPPLKSVFDQARRQARVLVLTSRGFDFAGRVPLPANVTFVGPQLDDPTWVRPWVSPWPASPARRADTCIEEERPLVLVSLGSTFQNQGPVLARLVGALGGLPVRALVTTAGVVQPGELGASENVVCVESAPHHAVLPHVALVVTHGGHGTVMKALSHGKPVVCVPFGRDQADNAARVEAAGAGVRVSKGGSTRTLRRTIERALGDRSLAEGARRVAEEIGRDQAEDRAVMELEQLAGRREASWAAVPSQA